MPNYIHVCCPNQELILYREEFIMRSHLYQLIFVKDTLIFLRSFREKSIFIFYRTLVNLTPKESKSAKIPLCVFFNANSTPQTIGE